MNDGPELKEFIVSRYMCTNCKWFRSKPNPRNWPSENITGCYHPVFDKGPFPGYGLNGDDVTPVGICPVLREQRKMAQKAAFNDET